MNLQRPIILFLLLALFIVKAPTSTAQIPTQTIRGQVLDKQSKAPLPGATIIVADSGQVQGSVTDINGSFRIVQVPIGRHTLKITFMGYRQISMPVIVNSGKELILNLEMEESVVLGKEVVITAERQKDKTNNEMTTVSARSFSLEETQRYAGSRNDPARMAANFAGVSNTNDSRNDIIIRGNSPLGVLWRLNGIDIPSPNHFGTFGSTGGPVCMLNNNLLDQSDFLTGAFPADYGNALAGVFDLKMRSGNNEKREYLGQLGLNGIEFGAEGPFSKKSKASYLINYRYSTLEWYHKAGVDLGAGSAIPKYQDLSFKVDVPTVNFGKFSLFGIGGNSSVNLLDSKPDPKKTSLYSLGTTDVYFKAGMGVVGLSHIYFLNASTYSKLNISASQTSNSIQQDSLAYGLNKAISFFPQYGNESIQVKTSLNYSINTKLNSRNTFSAGFNIDKYNLNFQDSALRYSTYFVKLRDVTDKSAFLYQSHALWQHRFSDKLTLNSGIHYQLFDLNNSQAIEPRAGLKWEFKEGQTLSFGTGMHSQAQNILTYFDKTRLPDGSYLETNKNLNFTRSNHFIIAYDRVLSKDMRLKSEAYYQNIYNAPVTSQKSFYSLLNYGADFSNPSVDSLVNKGDGRNYGIELTIEKFYSKNYYFLVTGSLFESKYTGSDGIERNSAFNGNYTFNMLGGKEFLIRKKNVIGLDLKVTKAGGRRYIPIDWKQTLDPINNPFGRSIYDFDNAYKDKLKDYFRMDVKFTFRKNGKKITQEWSLDIQNIFDTKNLFTQTYNATTKTIVSQYQLGIFFIPQYKILF